MTKRSNMEQQFSDFMEYPEEWNLLFTDKAGGSMEVNGTTDSGYSVHFAPSEDAVYWSAHETHTKLLMADDNAKSPQDALTLVLQYV